MGLRFQRRIRIGPGFRVNLGRRGAWFTVGPPRGTRAAVGAAPLLMALLLSSPVVADTFTLICRVVDTTAGTVPLIVH
jgi:hypothetical protein